jgi:hypothetical protein
MDIYRQSTQKKHWILDQAGLLQNQKQKVNKVLHTIAEIGKQTANEPGHKPSSLKLKPEEEKTLILYFTNILLDILKRKTSSNSLKVNPHITYSVTLYHTSVGSSSKRHLLITIPTSSCTQQRYSHLK